MNTQPPIPVLRSFDEPATRQFYLGFLGFQVFFEYRLDKEAPLYMGVYRDGCRLHLSEHHGDACPGSTLRIEVDDVDTLSEELNGKNYAHCKPAVIEQPWGYRELVVVDPSGNRLIFCTET